MGVSTRLAIGSAALVLTLLAAPLAAQPPSEGTSSDTRAAERQPAKQQTVILKGDLNLRQSPPEQKFFLFATPPGDKAGTLESRQEVEVLDRKTVKTLLEESVWLRVRLPDATTPEGYREAWIYGGKKDGEKTFVTKHDGGENHG